MDKIKDAIFERVKEIILDYIGNEEVLSDDEIYLSAPFSRLGIYVVDDIIEKLNDYYEIEIPSSLAKKSTRVEDVVNYIFRETQEL